MGFFQQLPISIYLPPLPKAEIFLFIPAFKKFFILWVCPLARGLEDISLVLNPLLIYMHPFCCFKKLFGSKICLVLERLVSFPWILPQKGKFPLYDLLKVVILDQVQALLCTIPDEEAIWKVVHSQQVLPSLHPSAYLGFHSCAYKFVFLLNQHHIILPHRALLRSLSLLSPIPASNFEKQAIFKPLVILFSQMHSSPGKYFFILSICLMTLAGVARHECLGE